MFAFNKYLTFKLHRQLSCFIERFLNRGFASLDPSRAKITATTVSRKDKAIPSEHWPNPSLFI